MFTKELALAIKGILFQQRVYRDGVWPDAERSAS
jgi:hypothetical protein